jgi:hypothetical protein
MEVVISVEWAKVEKTTGAVVTMTGAAGAWPSGGMMDAKDGMTVWEWPQEDEDTTSRG